jgi:SAM-dependent methyltransferase
VSELLPSELGAEELKSCCARLYESDIVRLLLGESYHPGGLTLTRRLARLAGVSAATEVLDVASGPGATALVLARELGASVVGVDLGPATIEAATDRAVEAGLGDRVEFRVGDAERLPVADASVDVVVCECAYCTFPDKVAAAAEMARVLRPGGRVGITDVVLDGDRLGDQLRSLAGWIACLADAQPIETYTALLEGAGLRVFASERHDDAMTAMIDAIEARLTVLRMLGALPPDLDLDQATELVAQARAAVADGAAGYVLLIAERPT